MRIDFHGIGDSTGVFAVHRLDRPNSRDVEAAVSWLRGHGLSHVVLVGTCFGARTALASASGIERLLGVALLACPLRDEGHFEIAASKEPLSWVLKQGTRLDSLKLLTNADRRSRALRLAQRRLRALAGQGLYPFQQARSHEWASERFLTPLEWLVRAQVPVLLSYGKGDDFYPDFERALDGRLGELLDEAGESVCVRIIEERLHGFPSVAVQDSVIEMLSTWLPGAPG